MERNGVRYTTMAHFGFQLRLFDGINKQVDDHQPRTFNNATFSEQDQNHWDFNAPSNDHDERQLDHQTVTAARKGSDKRR